MLSKSFFLRGQKKIPHFQGCFCAALYQSITTIMILLRNACSHYYPSFFFFTQGLKKINKTKWLWVKMTLFKSISKGCSEASAEINSVAMPPLEEPTIFRWPFLWGFSHASTKIGRRGVAITCVLYCQSCQNDTHNRHQHIYNRTNTLSRAITLDHYWLNII